MGNPEKVKKNSTLQMSGDLKAISQIYLLPAFWFWPTEHMGSKAGGGILPTSVPKNPFGCRNAHPIGLEDRPGLRS